MTDAYVAVALDVPLRATFDYRVPEPSPASLRPGQRVRVPFGRRRTTGIIMTIRETTQIDPAKLKAVIDVLDDAPAFDADLLALLIWAADYYQHPIGEVLFSALPAGLRSGAPLEARRTSFRLTGRAPPVEELPRTASRMRELMTRLSGPGASSSAEFAAIRGAGAVLRKLEQRGWIESFVTIDTGIPESPRVAPPATMALSEEQAVAVEAITTRFGSYANLLLNGVTGSGKTEVYLRAIAQALTRDAQALVLVPEIALTPQLVRRFVERFKAAPAVLHSGLTDTERLDSWRAARRGAARIVIGTRSAVFTPMPRLGLIIVDEEHDPSLKQQDGFRYSARDLAIARARRLGIPVVLGSATPSLESLERVRRKDAIGLDLPRRAGGAQPPRISLVDLRQHAAEQGLSAPAMRAVRKHLDAGGQVLVYLNRRGFAPVLFCASCGWIASCPRCDARMTVHRSTQRMRCHHCDGDAPVPMSCPDCAAETHPVGQGTERIEEVLARLYPDTAIARIDRDAVRRRGELEAALERVDTGDVRILVGTQMLTKGHHFPDVTLVVVLNADQGLFSTDFRASERLAQTIVQVAGRAGRAERAGEVLIQSSYPAHPLLTSLLSGGYPAFAAAALAERAAASWPPFARLALFRAEAANAGMARSLLITIHELCASVAPPELQILGPAAAPMERRAGRFRAQLLLRAGAAGPLLRVLRRVVPRIASLPQSRRARWSVDVDPIELL
jgi:primosomal protein N' (replication factor Y)